MARIGIALLLIIAVCSVDAHSLRRQKRVVGGERYQYGEFPFHVSLWYMGSNNIYTVNTPDLHHTCGGTLIRDDWVMTSGACFDDEFLEGVGNVSLWKVVLGMYDQRGAEEVGTFMEIESIHWPEEYDLNASQGDIALLKLTTKATLGDHIGLIDYNTDPDCPKVNQKSRVIGWGQNQSETYGYGEDYPAVGVVFISKPKFCENAYKEWINITDIQICAGRKQGGVDACYGDSGSPLLDMCDKKEVVTGIVSSGNGCATAEYPGIYTRVSSFADWITATISDSDSP